MNPSAIRTFFARIDQTIFFNGVLILHSDKSTFKKNMLEWARRQGYLFFKKNIGVRSRGLTEIYTTVGEFKRFWDTYSKYSPRNFPIDELLEEERNFYYYMSKPLYTQIFSSVLPTNTKTPTVVLRGRNFIYTLIGMKLLKDYNIPFTIEHSNIGVRVEREHIFSMGIKDMVSHPYAPVKFNVYPKDYLDYDFFEGKSYWVRKSVVDGVKVEPVTDYGFYANGDDFLEKGIKTYGAWIEKSISVLYHDYRERKTASVKKMRLLLKKIKMDNNLVPIVSPSSV